ncbi:MAG: hypothetical protein JNG88_13200 [Phycisphaerales bacterium]|nr:hypothetical protein [Phycisphaerales bacterium]
MKARRAAGLLSVGAALCALLVSSAAAQKADVAELRKLVDEIARGDIEDARDAADDLIARVLGPLTEAIGSVEKRPVEEQARLERALWRLTAQLRIRLVRIDLPEKDRQLFDKFAKDEPELAEQLFVDEADLRNDAIKRIPLEPNTVAGVLLAMKVADPDESVAQSAIEQADRLRDPTVLRGLQHFLVETTRIAQSEVFGTWQGAYILLYESRVRPCIKILGTAKHSDAVSDILTALPVFWRRELANKHQLPEVFDSLGRLGDERATKELMKYVSESDIYSSRHTPGNRLAILTVGDSALLAVIRIYQLNPADFGFYVESESSTVFGFLDPSERDAALSAFVIWQRDNADKPAAERKPPQPIRAPTSQPAGK